MHAKIRIQTGLPRTALEERLGRVAAGGPFRWENLSHQGQDRWSFTLQPLRPGLSLGFAKFAETLVLLAREFHIDTVERIALAASSAAPAAASADGASRMLQHSAGAQSVGSLGHDAGSATAPTI